MAARSAAVITGLATGTIGSAYGLTDYVVYPTWMVKDLDEVPSRRKDGFFMGKAGDPLKDWGVGFETVKCLEDTERDFAWEIRGEEGSKEWVIGVHGAGNDRREMLKFMNKIREETRANILLIDCRNHGKHEGGNGITMGVEEHKDIVNAVNFAKSKGSVKTVVLGTSQGAASSLLAAAKLEKGDIAGLILENPFCCGSEVLQTNLDKAFGKISEAELASDPILQKSIKSATDKNPLLHARSLVPSPYISLVHRLALTRMGYAPVHHSPISIADQISAPMLFMHGTEDTFVPISHTQRLAKAASEGAAPFVKEWYPAAKHSQLYNAHPEEFVDRVAEFYRSV